MLQYHKQKCYHPPPPTRPERSGREEAQAELTSLTEDYRLLEMELEEVAGKVEKLTEECQERSDQANQWYKTLQVLLTAVYIDLL